MPPSTDDIDRLERLLWVASDRLRESGASGLNFNLIGLETLICEAQAALVSWHEPSSQIGASALTHTAMRTLAKSHLEHTASQLTQQKVVRVRMRAQSSPGDRVLRVSIHAESMVDAQLSHVPPPEVADESVLDARTALVLPPDDSVHVGGVRSLDAGPSSELGLSSPLPPSPPPPPSHPPLPSKPPAALQPDAASSRAHAAMRGRAPALVASAAERSVEVRLCVDPVDDGSARVSLGGMRVLEVGPLGDVQHMSEIKSPPPPPSRATLTPFTSCAPSHNHPSGQSSTGQPSAALVRGATAPPALGGLLSQRSQRPVPWWWYVDGCCGLRTRKPRGLDSRPRTSSGPFGTPVLLRLLEHYQSMLPGARPPAQV